MARSADDQKTLELAFGRILRLASRPEQAGDVSEYERCRSIMIDLLPSAHPDYTHNYQRDRLRGAQGDRA